MCRAVPASDRLGDGAIADQHRVNRGAQESLDKQRGRLIRADKVAQRAKDGAVAELFSLAQQSGSRRRKTNAFALQRVECVDLSLERCVSLVGAKQLGAGRRLTVAGIAVGGSHFLESCRCVLDAGTRFGDSNGGGLQLAVDRRERVGELRPLRAKLLDALGQFVALVARTLAIDLRPAQAILCFAMMLLGLVERGAREGDALSRLVLLALSLRERFTRDTKLIFTHSPFVRGLLAIRRNTSAVRFAFVRFELGALPAGKRIALPFLGDGHLAADLLDSLALR